MRFDNFPPNEKMKVPWPVYLYDIDSYVVWRIDVLLKLFLKKMCIYKRFANEAGQFPKLFPNVFQ